MNLLHITPYYAPAWAYGGVVRAVTDLTRAQVAAGHKVVVLTTDTLDRSRRIAVREETIDGVAVTRVRNQSNAIRGRLNLSTPVGLEATALQLIQERTIDLVHCHELRTVENLLISPITRSRGLPLVVSSHGTLPYHVGRRRSKQLWDRVFGRQLLPCFDRVITLTEVEADEARALWAGCGVPLRPDQVAEVPNAICTEEFAHMPSGDLFRRQWGLGSGPVVIFVGRLAERKGLQLLIPAFAEAAQDVPHARLLIVGPDEGVRSKLDIQIEECNLTGRVIFTGLLVGDDRLAALAASDIFALPAVGEGFSMAALEAMACGLPVLLTTGCHFPEVAPAGAGLVVPRETGPLGEALRGLLLDGHERALMGKRAHELVHSRYLWPQVVAQMEAVYEMAARDRRDCVHESAPSQPRISSGAAKIITRNASALTLSAILTKGLLFLWQIYLARTLGGEGYGIYGTIGALLIIGASIPEFGMGLIVIRDVASRPQDAGRYLAATLTIQPLLAVIGYVALIIVAAALGYDAGLRGLVALASVSLLIDTLGNMAYNQLIAFERMAVAAIISIGHIAVLIILGAAALSANGGLWSLYKMILAAGCLRVLAYWVAILRAGVCPVFPVSGVLVRYLFINGVPFALTAFISLASINSVKLIATAMIGAEVTGQLMASFVIVFGVIELLNTPALVTVFPLMSRLHNSGKSETFNLMLEKLSFFTMLAGLPLAVYISLLAVPVSTLVFGSDFVQTAVALRIMIWYTVVAMIVNVFSRALTTQNRQQWLLVVRMIGLALNIALNIVLLPRLGIAGAAMAMIVTEMIVLELILRSLNLPVEWWRRMIAHVWRLGIASLTMAAIISVLTPVHPVLAVLMGLPVFAGLLFLMGVITEEDRALLYQVVEGVSGGAWVARF